LRQQAHQRRDEIIAYGLSEPGPPSFLAFEAALLGLRRSLGALLIQLFLRAHHDRIDRATWQARGYRVADPAAGRTLKTSCGPVPYPGFLTGGMASGCLPCHRWSCHTHLWPQPKAAR
jgi:hypothetical protein